MINKVATKLPGFFAFFNFFQPMHDVLKQSGQAIAEYVGGRISKLKI